MCNKLATYQGTSVNHVFGSSNSHFVNHSKPLEVSGSFLVQSLNHLISCVTCMISRFICAIYFLLIHTLSHIFLRSVLLVILVIIPNLLCKTARQFLTLNLLHSILIKSEYTEALYKRIDVIVAVLLF